MSCLGLDISNSFKVTSFDTILHTNGVVQWSDTWNELPKKSEVFVLTLGSGNQSKVGQFVQWQIEIQGRINLNFGNV